MRRQNARPWPRILLLVCCVAIGLVGVYRYVYVDHFSMAARAVGSIRPGSSTEELGLDTVPYSIDSMDSMTERFAAARLAADARRGLGGRCASDMQSGGVRNLALGYADGSRATLIFKARDETRTRRRRVLSLRPSSGGITGSRESKSPLPLQVRYRYRPAVFNPYTPPKFTPPKLTPPKYTPRESRTVTETYTTTVWRYEASRIGLWFEPPDDDGLPGWP